MTACSKVSSVNKLGIVYLLYVFITHDNSKVQELNENLAA